MAAVTPSDGQGALCVARRSASHTEFNVPDRPSKTKQSSHNEVDGGALLALGRRFSCSDLHDQFQGEKGEHTLGAGVTGNAVGRISLSITGASVASVTGIGCLGGYGAHTKSSG